MQKKHGPWTITGSRQVYRNGHIEVNEDQVLRPDGEPGVYATVKTKTGVAVLPMDEAGGVVFLTRQFRYGLGAESLEACSGGLSEQGEEPIKAARRELKEELGIEAGRWDGLGIVDIDTSIIQGPVHLFLARGLHFSETEREGTETIRTVRMPLTEALERVDRGEITHAASVALILKAARLLRSRGR